MTPAETALLLRLASADLRERGWARPLGDEIDPASATIPAALARVAGLPLTSWASLADPRLHDAWDALVLGLACVTGLPWKQPRTGLDQIGRVLGWERSPIACAEDVLAVLDTAAVLAESACALVACPSTHIEQWTIPPCEICGGEGVLALRPKRWSSVSLRLVRGGA